ncbi:MAG: hypothetical protein ABFR50_05505, partial [Candidatus Fermentibacteria bacterium]
NDSPRFVHPPYETELQKYGIEKMRENIEDNDKETKKLLRRRYRETFLAGGGSLSTFYRYMKSNDARSEEWKAMVLEQLGNRSYYHGISGSHFFCVRGFKPKID